MSPSTAHPRPIVRAAFGALRIVTVGLIAAAVIGQFSKSLSLVDEPGRFVINFFSFFTIQSNLIGAAVLLIAFMRSFSSRKDSTVFTIVRLCAATYLTTTLVVFNTLLRDLALDQAATVPWSNEILHVWAPLLVLIDWLFAPGRRALPWSRLWIVAIYPIVWAVYTMIRGALTSWYPYPFLNPHIEPGVGYDGVTVYIAAIASFILLVGAALIWVSRKFTPASQRR